MGYHTFDVARADTLEDPDRFRHCSVEELLGALAPGADDVVADLGSGTGFYTDPVAPHVETCYAVDVQSEMHDRYREKGVPSNVGLVTAEVSDLPFEDDALDAAFSTFTHHEYAEDDALAELSRVLRPGGRVVTIDWSAEASGDAGPPLDERYDLATCVGHFEGFGFGIDRASTRVDTYLCVARNR